MRPLMIYTLRNMGLGGESVNGSWNLFVDVVLMLEGEAMTLLKQLSRARQRGSIVEPHQRVDVRFIMEGSCALDEHTHLVQMIWNEMMVQDDTPHPL